MSLRTRILSHLFAAFLLALAGFAASALAQNVPPIEAAAQELMAGEAGIIVEGPAGEPPVGRILKDGEPIAVYGSSYALIGSAGYSGKPVDVLVIVNTNATVRAARLLTQDEPILTIGIGADALDTYVAGFAGVDVRQPARRLVQDGAVPDGVSGATISSGVIRDAVLRTGRLLAERADTAPGPDLAASEARPNWEALLSKGMIRLRSVSFAEAGAAMPGVSKIPEQDGTFAEFAVAVLDDRAVADALVGAIRFDRLATEFAADDTILLVAARGLYSIKGTAWIKTGTFDRLEISTPGGAPFNPTREMVHRLDRLYADGASEFREIMLVGVPAGAGFVPDAPLTVALVVDKTDEGAAQPARFSLEVNAPPATAPAAETFPGDADEPLWLENWRDATADLAILGILLMALFLILYISGPIVRRPRLYFWLRAAFLSVTLVWTGWIAGAQLSIVQLVAFVQALIGGFNWDVFLLAPLIFVIWAFVALCILFWGRGVYCGWLCPFGALQELLHKAGQRLGVKRIEIPWEIHERLWPVKYIALLAIIAISLKDMTLAFKAAEIEPFKTAIILHFLRDWPFVLYAGVLLGLGLFVERFYCRYLCPLGAALAIPSKFKIFDWLTRRPQCGRECRLCATTCTVQAIDPIGRINPNECIYCLKCQVNYHDSQTCVPLKMRARRAAASPAAAANEV